jgi:ssDNA-binding Zn-finger/Zn-ribbon topoisomerase 1
MQEFLRTASLVERKLIRKTDVTCDVCGLAKFIIESPGSETASWLRCPNCNQYYYMVGNIVCTFVINESGKEIKRETIFAELLR